MPCHNKRQSLGVALLGLAVVASGAALAKAKPEASFPAREGRSLLVFECNEEQAIWLRIWHPQRGWLGDRAAEVRIGASTFKMEIDGASDSFILSNLPMQKMGVTNDLLAAAKSGDELVLAGLAAEQIAGPRRSFALKGARAKIERVEQACGRSPARPS